MPGIWPFTTNWYENSESGERADWPTDLEAQYWGYDEPADGPSTDPDLNQPQTWGGRWECWNTKPAPEDDSVGGDDNFE